MRKKYGKRYSKKRKFKKRHGKFYKMAKKVAKMEIFKAADIKTSVLKNQILPAGLLQTGYSMVWMPVDRGLAYGSSRSWDKVVNGDNTYWGYNANKQNYTQYANAPFLIGNRIKRISFQIKANIYAALYLTTNNPWVLQTTSPLTVFPGPQGVMEFRIDVARPADGITNATFENMLGALGATDIEAPLNPTVAVSCWRKTYRVNGLNNASNAMIVINKKFKGKRGSQWINLPANYDTGNLDSNYMTSNSLYVICRWNAFNFTSGAQTYQVAPLSYQFDIVTKYFDI